MSNMNLPGVRRIEALIGVLKSKEKEAIAEASKTLPLRSTIERMVCAEMGLTEIFDEVVELRSRVNVLSDQTQAAFGYGMSINESSYGRNGTPFSKRVRELERELRDIPLDEIRAEFKRKESELWLVESIEQAKAIVGI